MTTAMYLAALAIVGAAAMPSTADQSRDACGRGDSQACLDLANVYFAGNGVPKDVEKAKAILETACAAGAASSCNRLAAHYGSTESGASGAMDKAAAFSERACDLGDEHGCFMLAYNGNKDPDRRIGLRKKSCDGGRNGEGCLWVGEAYHHGSGARVDLVGAADYYRKACDLHNASGCYSLAMMLSNGEGVATDKLRASVLYGAACAGGQSDETTGFPASAWGCFNLAVLYSTGEGVLRSGAAAAEAYSRAGQLFLKANKRDDALRSAERIKGLGAVPNAFLGDKLMASIYGEGPGPAEATPEITVAFGTAWPIASGYFVTNYHVVKGSRTITLRLPSGEQIAAEVGTVDPANDIALLVPSTEVRAKALPIAPHAPQVGEHVFAIGYPHPDLLGAEAKVTEGIVSAASGLGGDPRTLQISVPVQGGNSGGPLLDMQGRVVGIIVSKLNAAQVFKWTGDLPENVSYAIKTAYLTPLLPDVPTRWPVTPAGPASLAALVQRVRSSVAIVVVNQPGAR